MRVCFVVSEIFHGGVYGGFGKLTRMRARFFGVFGGSNFNPKPKLKKRNVNLIIQQDEIPSDRRYLIYCRCFSSLVALFHACI
jgi:hypothetical protein